MEFRDMKEPQTIIFHRLIKDFYIINGKVIYKGMNYPELDRLLVSKDNSRSIVSAKKNGGFKTGSENRIIRVSF